MKLLQLLFSLIILAAPVMADTWASSPAAVTSKPVDRNWTDPSTGIQFVYLPKGCFNMGSPSHEEGRYTEEAKHPVCIDQGFWMSKYEITNAQFRKMVSSHDSKAYGGHSLNEPKQPAVFVSWDEATEYAQWLSDRSAYTFRLPTEAEWEYAARGNTSTARYWGDNADAACRYANVADNMAKDEFSWGWIHHNCRDEYAVSSPVGQFKPNAFGLYDMLGSVCAAVAVGTIGPGMCVRRVATGFRMTLVTLA